MKKRMICVFLALLTTVFAGACGRPQMIEEKKFVFVGSGGAITVTDRQKDASWFEIRSDGTYFGNIDFARPEFKKTYEGRYDLRTGFEAKNGLRVEETASGLTVTISTGSMNIDARFVLVKD